MMEIYQKNKKIFLFVGIFLFVVIIYFIFSSGSGSAPQTAPSATSGGLISEATVSPVDEAGGRELLAMLTELHSISLDASLFGSSVFGSLNDLSRPIEPQPLGSTLGRRNPFSDFSGTATVPAGTGAASTLPVGSSSNTGN